MRVIDIDFDILLDKKPYKTYENILIYDIPYKTFMGAKLLRIMVDEIDGFIKIYYRIKYLVLFGSGQYDEIYNTIRYLISEKSGITDIISHNFERIRIDSYNSLPIEKTQTFHNVIILIKLVVNKNKNNYYYNIFLEKGSYKESNTHFLNECLYIINAIFR